MSSAARSTSDRRIRIDDETRVLVLTGAGVSAESGIPTFRGSGGLWESHPVEFVASPRGFRENPSLVWRFYSERRAHAGKCSPNPGHRALVELEERLGDRFLLATQNVDGLHRKAGTQRLVELHGNLFHTRCDRCDRAPFEDHALYDKRLRLAFVKWLRAERQFEGLEPLRVQMARDAAEAEQLFARMAI